MVRSLPSCRMPQIARAGPTLRGVVRARMHVCLLNSVCCSPAWMKVIWEWCCSWHRRWQGGRPFDGSKRSAFIGPLLPHLCPPRLLSLSYLSAGSNRKSSPLAVCVRRQVRQGQFTQGRDYFIQLRQFLLRLSTFSLQRLDNFGYLDACHIICDLL